MSGELKYLNELPDYIKGNIKDTELKEEIEKELKVNDELNNEYLKLKLIFSKLENTEIFNAPDNYFNNFLPKLNERLDNRLFIRLRKIIFNWKFAISLAVIALVFILYKPIANYFVKEEVIVKLSDSTFISSNDLFLDTTINKIETKTEEFDQEIKIKQTYKYPSNETKFIETNNGNEVIEFFEEDETEIYQEYFDFEDEFEKLPPEEQKLFLENFEKIKI